MIFPRSNTIAGAQGSLQRWKDKFDVLTQEKKNWLVERRSMRTKLKELTDQNMALEQRVKELAQTLDFAQNYLHAQEFSYINPLPTNNNNTQITQMPLGMFDGLGDFSQFSHMIPRLSGDAQRQQTPGKTPYFVGEGDAEKAGAQAADQTVMLNGESFQSRSFVNAATNKSQLDEIRRIMAQNIAEIEQQNRLAEQRIQEQRSLLFSNQFERSELRDASRHEQHPDDSNFNFEVGDEPAFPKNNNVNLLPQRSTLDDVKLVQSQMHQLSQVRSQGQSFSTSMAQGNSNSNQNSIARISPHPEIQGDNDEVDQSVTPQKRGKGESSTQSKGGLQKTVNQQAWRTSKGAAGLQGQHA